MNKELGDLHNQLNIIHIIKSKRLRWEGHVKRQSQRIIKLVQKEVPDEKRPLGRRRLRWRDNLAADLKTVNIDGADEIMKDTDIWRQVVKSIKTYSEL